MMAEAIAIPQIRQSKAQKGNFSGGEDYEASK